MPAYLKGHSKGEYVFDHSWADAFDVPAGSTIPSCNRRAVHPAGPRLLLSDEVLAVPCRAPPNNWANGFSSAHATFVEPEQQALFEEAGWMLRHDIQFHWQNRDFSSFDDFLATLASRKRRSLKKERAAAQADVEIVHLRGPEIEPRHWDAFWVFYQDTGARWASLSPREAFELFSSGWAIHCC